MGGVGEVMFVLRAVRSLQGSRQAARSIALVVVKKFFVPGGGFRRMVFAVVVIFIVICTVVYCGVSLGVNKVDGRIFLTTFRRLVVVKPVTFVLSFFLMKPVTGGGTFVVIGPRGSGPFVVILTVSILSVVKVYPLVDLTTALLFGSTKGRVVTI